MRGGQENSGSTPDGIFPGDLVFLLYAYIEQMRYLDPSQTLGFIVDFMHT